jgi:uncharacterized membrane protein
VPDSALRPNDDADGPDALAPPTAAAPRVHDVMDIGSLFVAVALFTVLVAGGTSAVRDVTGAAFTVFVPGWAVVSNLTTLRRPYAGLAVVLSLALLALVATVTLWAHLWHPVGLAEVECVVASALLVLSLVRRGRARRSGGP